MNNHFLGKWRITWMENWDQAFVDLEGPGYFQFDKKDKGEFQFGAVRGSLNCRLAMYGNAVRVEFSWVGYDELDEASGRGWAVTNGGKIEGHVFIHDSEDSNFKAEKAKS